MEGSAVGSPGPVTIWVGWVLERRSKPHRTSSGGSFCDSFLTPMELDDEDFGIFGGEDAQTGLPDRIWFGHAAAPPLGSGLQVQFPRLDLVIEGCYRNELWASTGETVTCDIGAGEALFVPGGCWNAPGWDEVVELVSILFGALHLGVSRMVWYVASRRFTSVQQASGMIPANGPPHHMTDSLASMNGVTSTANASALLQCQAVVAHCRGLENSKDSRAAHGSKEFFLAT